MTEKISFCTICMMDCREITELTCPDCAENCPGCLSKECPHKEIMYANEDNLEVKE
jgi:hypothetical protein